MDRVAWKKTVLEFTKKYRFLLAAVLAGLLLLTLPQRQATSSQLENPLPTSKPNLQDDLSAILSQIAGAGNVKVLLTIATGEETVYQTDEDISTGEASSNIHRDTVLTTLTDRTQAGLIRQVIPATYRGAIVLCQGGDNAQVKLAIVEAVKSVTGLRSDCITVLKMK